MSTGDAVRGINGLAKCLMEIWLDVAHNNHPTGYYMVCTHLRVSLARTPRKVKNGILPFADQHSPDSIISVFTSLIALLTAAPVTVEDIASPPAAPCRAM